MKSYVNFEINGNKYEITQKGNGYELLINTDEDKYLLESYESALEFLLMLLEAKDEDEKVMIEKTYFHEQYELEGLTDDEEIEDYDDCDYEVGFNPYMGCYDYDC